MRSGGTLGPYRIDTLIGAGGMGEVYRAHDPRLQRDVAIKVLTGYASSDPDARRRLLREARTAAALNHPHVCTIHEVGEADGQAYIAMELIEGESLDRCLPPGGFPLDRVLRYGLQIAEAVAHAHHRGIVHGDLKTANTVITPQGYAKVLDFGLARRLSGEVAEVATETQSLMLAPGAVAGTLAYMAPEQLRGEPADARSDVWALGVLLYEMAVGERPFRGQTGFELSAAILSEKPPPVPDGVPSDLRGLIERCLTKAAERRYQRAGEVHAVLEGIVHDEARANAPAAASRRQRLVIAGTLAAVAAALAGGSLVWIGSREPATPPATVAARERTRIAVLPFDNLSRADEEFFVDGIARDINTQISKLAQFVVIGHGSAERARRTGAGYADMARQLNVDYVVDGSVSRAGSRVRISVSLIDPATSGQIWADTYDREITVSNIFAARTDVALKVASALHVTLTTDERSDLAAPTTGSLEAYQEYQQGRFLWAKRTVPDLKAAAGHFERAITLDPGYALAHAGLADVYVLLPFFDGNQTPRAALARADAAASRALELDPSLGQAHTTLGLVREFEFNWTAAEQHFRRGVELSPGYATAHHWYADMLARQRRFAEGLAVIRKAIDLDPLSSIINQDLGYVLTLSGDGAAGMRQYERTLELDPGFASTWCVMAFALLDNERFEEAAQALRRWAELTGRDPEALARFAKAVAGHRQTGAVQRVPENLDAERAFGPGYIAPAYALLGQKERALLVLERAYEQRTFATIASMLHGSFDTLRTEPRFVALLAKAGLPPRP